MVARARDQNLVFNDIHYASIQLQGLIPRDLAKYVHPVYMWLANRKI